jgi:hypothetical protein
MRQAAIALAEWLFACRDQRRGDTAARETVILYIRTASGDFINAATIVQLSPQHHGIDDEITGWVAICGDGRAIALADYYAEPGRIETVLGAVPVLDGKVFGQHMSRLDKINWHRSPYAPQFFLHPLRSSIVSSARRVQSAAPTALEPGLQHPKRTDQHAARDVMRPPCLYRPAL